MHLGPPARLGRGHLPPGELRAGAGAGRGGLRGLGIGVTARLAVLGAVDPPERRDVFLERGRLAGGRDAHPGRDPGPSRRSGRPAMVPGPFLPAGRPIRRGDPTAGGQLRPAWSRLVDGALDEVMSVLRLYIPWGLEAPSVEEVRGFLDQAGRSAPDDDQVWLGKANLAIRQGAWDEASRRLDACLRRRPEDVSGSGRAYLNWAVGSGRVAEARKALTHLPAHEASSAQVHRLSAWFASRRGDSGRRANRGSERLIAADPADVAALDRLAELAAKDGRNDRRDEIRRMKAELGQSRRTLSIPAPPQPTAARRGRDGRRAPRGAASAAGSRPGSSCHWRRWPTRAGRTSGTIWPASILEASTPSPARDARWPTCLLLRPSG